MTYLPFPDISPDIFSIDLFGMTFALRWYALAYIAGLVIGWRIVTALVRRPALWRDGPPMTAEQVESLLTWIILGVIIGGRMGFVLFYQPAQFLANPGQILRVWEGGMSFHGGLIGTIVALILFARRQGMTVLTIADLAAGVTPVGLGLGRIGNFINGELYGRPTDVDWCMVFPAGGMACRHPSQLYEAFLEGLLLFTVLWLITRCLPPSGTVFGAFLMGYGICRIVVEFFREPDAQIGFLVGTISMGQMLSIPMIVAGAVILAIAAQRKRPLQPDSGTAAPL